MAQLKFNAAEVDTTSRDAIPSGTYEAVVTDSETRATKNGNGMGINLTFEILSEGPAKGRKVFAWINYENASAKAQQIGREELASLCKAVGVTELEDTVQLHNLPLLITVGLDRNDPTKNVGYSAKEQGSKSPAGIITFQWDDVNGKTVYLNGFIKPSVAGTAYEHGVNGDFTPGWEKSAPQIQVRDSLGGYAIRYYADDMWDDDLCAENSDPDGDGIDGIAGWGDETGVYDATTTLSLGGGAWIKSPSADCTFTTAGAVASEETAVGGDTTISILAGGAFPVAFKLNDSNAVTWKLTPGTGYDHGANGDFTPGWEKSAPQIQVRDNLGGYAIRYYADDMWDDDLCAENSDPDGDGIDGIAGWGDEFGGYDSTTTVEVGGGFWLKQPNGDKRIFITVKNPIK